MKNKKMISLVMAATTVAPMAVPAFAAETRAVENPADSATNNPYDVNLFYVKGRDQELVTRDSLSEKMVELKDKNPEIVYQEKGNDGLYTHYIVEFDKDFGPTMDYTIALQCERFQKAKAFLEYAWTATDKTSEKRKLYDVTVRTEDYKVNGNGKDQFTTSKKVVTVRENTTNGNSYTYTFVGFDTEFKAPEEVEIDEKTIKFWETDSANKEAYKQLASAEYAIKRAVKNNKDLVVTSKEDRDEVTNALEGYTVNIYKKTNARGLIQVGRLIIDGKPISTSLVKHVDLNNDFAGHWAEQTIVDAMLNGVVSKQTKFNPKSAITRADFAVILYNTFKNEQGQLPLGEAQMSRQIKFTDVAKNAYYGTAVSKLAEAGYINGNPDGSFKPNSTITRQEAAKMVSDIIANIKRDNAVEGTAASGGIIGRETYVTDAKGNKYNVSVNTKFADDALIANWADESIQYATEVIAKGSVLNRDIKGAVLNGDKGTNKVRPKDTISRAEALIMAERALVAVN